MGYDRADPEARVTGQLTDMTERQILFRLVADVESLKSEAAHGSRSREHTRQKVEAIEGALQELNRKMDKIIDQEERLAEVERGVEDYRTTKLKIVSAIAGIGLGGGSIGGFLGAMIAKIFGNGP